MKQSPTPACTAHLPPGIAYLFNSLPLHSLSLSLSHSPYPTQFFLFLRTQVGVIRNTWDSHTQQDGSLRQQSFHVFMHSLLVTFAQGHKNETSQYQTKTGLHCLPKKKQKQIKKMPYTTNGDLHISPCFSCFNNIRECRKLGKQNQRL